MTFIPLIGVYSNNRIAHKVSDYYESHPKKYGFRTSQLRDDVQTLMDVFRAELVNEDMKTKNKYGIMKTVNEDYTGIKVLRRPGRFRKLYWIELTYY
jgi:hypothetical protein